MLIIVNVAGAKQFGWSEVCHLLYPEDTVRLALEGFGQIRDLEELGEISPHVCPKRRPN